VPHTVAVCASSIEHGDTAPPGTTIVAALVHKRRLTVGWVGDSRAYWVSPSGSELLTRDHSWVNETVAHGGYDRKRGDGRAARACADSLPRSARGRRRHEDRRRRARTFACGPYRVQVTWSYARMDCGTTFRPRPTSLSSSSPRDAASDTASIARILVNHALARGGGDNVSVAIYAHD
jgi:serine/threonine protein phosphatase PrpC